MREVFASLVEILRESSGYLILGFALAGQEAAGRFLE